MTGGIWRGVAPAKLNLYLHIVGRRADGYHLLDSLVAFAAVGDGIELSPAEATRLVVTGPFAAAVPSGSDNLALRAAVALADAIGQSPRVAITLDKRLPVAAGIGGGSADAAAVLRGLAELWRLPPGDPRPAAAAATLGADVPACLAGRSCFVGGIGEQLDPGPRLAGVPVVLVNPGIPLPTPEVFRARADAGFSEAARFPDEAPAPPALAALLASRRNDLTEAACRLAPALRGVLAELAARPGCLFARMSGSGATCFGLFGTTAQAREAAGALARPGWWAAASELL